LKLEDIFAMWEKDAEIDVLSLARESASAPKLHHKYMTIYTTEWIKLKKLRENHKKLVFEKREYYSGEMSKNDLDAKGWKPFPKKILKKEISEYIEGDSDVINSSLAINLAEGKVEYLESILREIGRRSFHVKNIIDWEKFRVGAS